MKRCGYKNRDPNGPNKANGYHRDLYRNSYKGKIAGVCAGFADYFDVPTWVARLVFISLVIFTFQLALIAYVIAYFMMSKRPEQVSHTEGVSRDKKVFNYNKPISSRLQDIRERLNRLDSQVGTMESYVTSKRYHTTNEINDL